MRMLVSLMYVAAMIAANLSIAYFGPASAPVNAFLFIGFDLAMRDWLQEQFKHRTMMILILCASAITYVTVPGADRIAVASAVAFLLAASCDYATFTAVKGPWLRRSNLSNLVGAAIDSFAFTVIAFGSVMPDIILLQFCAKVAGASIWSLAIDKLRAA